MSFQDTSLRVPFSEHEGDIGRLSLEVDRERTPEPSSRTSPLGLQISVQNEVLVRLYPQNGGDVRAISGSIRPEGDDVDRDRQQLILFDPDTGIQTLPVGVINVRVAQVGRAFDAAGENIGVTYRYDAPRNAIIPSVPHYGAARVTYDYPYSLYRYTFSGACPDIPPQQFDSSGNALPRTGPAPFSDGLIMAVNLETQQLASLTLPAPACQYGRMAFNFNDTRRDQYAPQMAIEIDPDFPVRLVGSGGALRAEANVLVFPAAAGDVLATRGTLLLLGEDVMEVTETVSFSGSSSARLSKTPVAGVSFSIVAVDAPGTVSFAQPGSSITDVVYREDGSYSNPRSRLLNPDEIAAIDVFRHPQRVLAVVRVRYSATFRRYRYTFSWDNTRQAFAQAYVVAADTVVGRAAFLEMNPPTLQNLTRRAT